MTDYSHTEPLSASDERMWATLVHVGGIFFSFVPALLGYLLFRERGPLVRAHTATALNFQISMALYTAASVVISTVLMIVLIGFLTIWLIPSVIGLLVVVFSIVAAVRANRGEPFVYPLTIPFVR